MVYLLSVVLFAVKDDNSSPGHTGAGLMANLSFRSIRKGSEDAAPPATTTTDGQVIDLT